MAIQQYNGTLNDITITTKGKEILGKIISGESFNIYKVKIGTGTLPSTEKEEDQTDLITQYKEIAVNSVTPLDAGGYQIEVVYDNLGVTALTNITELGIYMADATSGETLYAYSYSATPLVLIPESKGVVEITNMINVYLVDGDSVTATIDKSLTYVTIEDLEQKLKLKMDVSAAGSGFGLHKSDAIDSDDSDTVATSKAVHDVNVKVDADKKILTSTTTTANNAVANAKTALDTANTKMTQTQGDARYPLITDDWKDTTLKTIECSTITDPDTWAKTAEYGEYILHSFNTEWVAKNKWPHVSGAEARLRVIKTYDFPTYRVIELIGYDGSNSYRTRVLQNNVWEEWTIYYSNLNKPTKADVGLGSVGNHGITDSTTANNSSIYASSKAVTTVHNEAHAASTAAAKAQTTANTATTNISSLAVKISGINVAANTDLNTLTEKGNYYCSSTAAATSMKNIPSKVAFSLVVTPSAGVTQTFYEYFNTATAQIYQRNQYSGNWGPWRQIYHSGRKPTATDVGLGSVHNYGITDSTTANNSSIYASSKAVTTVHNEAHAASTAAVKAQTTANAAVPKTDVYSGGGTGYAGVVNKIPKVGTDGVIELGRYIDMHQIGDTLDYYTRLGSETDKSFSVSNANGYIQIGPKDSSNCHIYTDRPTFYFNKELLVNNHKVYNEGFKPPITDSTTANSSTTYASSKAVTTVHNEATAASTAASKAQTTANGALPKAGTAYTLGNESGGLTLGMSTITTNWARGYNVRNHDGSQISGFGVYGNGQKFNYTYMSYGTSESSNALRVYSTYPAWGTQKLYHEGHKPSVHELDLYTEWTSHPMAVGVKVPICRIHNTGNSGYAANIELTCTGTVGNSVLNISGKIMVSHNDTMLVDMKTGNYTKATVTIDKDVGSDAIVSLTLHNGSQVGSLPVIIRARTLNYCEIIPITEAYTIDKTRYMTSRAHYILYDKYSECPYLPGDVLVTTSDSNPSGRWPGTTWNDAGVDVGTVVLHKWLRAT